MACRVGIATMAAGAALAACAQPTLPPGGPPDALPPALVGVTPDSGSVNVRVGEVVFTFDEVISETPQGAQSLDRAVFVSPSTGTPDVRWRRTRLSVRPRGGWRDSTTYVVTLLPVIADLRGNVRDSTTVLVFSTGAAIPDTRLTGVVFNWPRGEAAARALVEARPARDSTLVYRTEADSVGRFSLPFLSPGEYVVRGIVDANRNLTADPREPWDTVRVVLSDTASRELYAFVHDSTPPRITSTAVIDSVTLRVTLDGPLAPDVAIAGLASLFTRDSTPVPVLRVVPWSVVNEERAVRDRARRDSVERADTSATARAARDRRLRDSVNRAAAIADSIARDTKQHIPPPALSRPPLISELAIVLATPLETETPYRLALRVVGMLGTERIVQSIFTRPAPAPAVPPDTTALRPPPAPPRSP